MNGFHKQGGLAASELHRLFLKSLGPSAAEADSTSLETKPLQVEVYSPLPSPLRAYLYTLTYAVAERKQGAYRSQVILPGALAGERRRTHLDTSDGAFVVLGGYEPDIEVFCFWDAGIYDAKGFTYSRGLQVDDVTIYNAGKDGLAEQTRWVRPGRGKAVPETVVSARRDQLVAGLARRWELTCLRLLTT